MSPERKIETLTRAWYGYAFFAAVLSVFSLRANGLLGYMLGLPFAAAINFVVFLISCAITGFFGRRLMAKSNGTRRFLVFVSALFTLLGVLSTLTGSWAFLTQWSLASLVTAILAGTSTVMNARSYNVLTETSVRAYFV
jgi:hypothetical protein